HFTEYDHSSNDTGQLYLRLEFENVPSLKEDLEATLQTHQIDFKLFDDQQHTKLALFVSKEDHTFNEILLRVNRNELPNEIVCIIINHEINRQIAETLHIPFYYITNNENKAIVKRKILDVCSEYQVAIIVLATYMLILSEHFVSH